MLNLPEPHGMEAAVWKLRGTRPWQGIYETPSERWANLDASNDTPYTILPRIARQRTFSPSRKYTYLVPYLPPPVTPHHRRLITHTPAHPAHANHRGDTPICEGDKSRMYQSSRLKDT
ncbi:predicted protein [Aspergillus terreus NIH2624]|uniref:Uncharacterized protein n=1 Tax=Aspergillus terreus (strain NIH 2624 / FGSC A1156) TaxID=341663 RepID=Q0CWE2_ASPTN|nr:uncharacterized protein ATEG_01992 [Aspergillus terreus NIH2624]EAU36954.1 predicted protein [Aspergillus terreus NIH2624]